MRADELRKRVRRFRLVFCHMGSMFEPLRDILLASVGGQVAEVSHFAARSHPIRDDTTLLLLTGLEDFANGDSNGVTLGQLRQRVDEALDDGFEVCLLSRKPRAAFDPVAGSSLLDDSSVYCLPLLGSEEVNADASAYPESLFPGVGLQAGVTLDEVYKGALRELGLGVLAALDYAIFERPDRKRFLESLEPREIEALRTAGLVVASETSVSFSVPIRINEFATAVADVLAESVHLQRDLPAVSGGLWAIERTIRSALRAAAIGKHGTSWRRRVLQGDLSSKALERARLDAYPTATNVSALRDPIEWLSLGELLQTVESKDYGGLAFDSVTWGRFKQDILPIRNRLSHMRLLRKTDRDLVSMWEHRVKDAFR